MDGGRERREWPRFYPQPRGKSNYDTRRRRRRGNGDDLGELAHMRRRPAALCTQDSSAINFARAETWQDPIYSANCFFSLQLHYRRPRGERACANEVSLCLFPLFSAFESLGLIWLRKSHIPAAAAISCVGNGILCVRASLGGKGYSR